MRYNTSMKIKLAKIEARLQSLIEGGAALLFPSAKRQKGLANSLVEAMHSGTHQDAQGNLIAPNLYYLFVPPSQAELLQNNLSIFDDMTRLLLDAGTEAGLTFPSPPVIRIAEDPAMAEGEWQVVAQNSLENLPQTSDMDIARDFEASLACDVQSPVVKPGTPASSLPSNAFLIVDGTQIFNLEQAVINIGRRSDNQLVINDARVSRVHAQLRAVRGHFVIFDLDSTGGTFVNGEKIHQSTLYPGDVVSLSGVPLVFGQDTEAQGKTQDYDPSAYGGRNLTGNEPPNSPHRKP